MAKVWYTAYTNAKSVNTSHGMHIWEEDANMQYYSWVNDEHMSPEDKINKLQRDLKMYTDAVLQYQKSYNQQRKDIEELKELLDAAQIEIVKLQETIGDLIDEAV